MLKKKIPTLLGLLVLVIGAVVGVIFVDQQTDFLPRATPEYIPTDIKITNLSASGFSVSWLTQEPTIGFVKMGTSIDAINITVVDDRDLLTGSSGQYRSHYITAQELNPSTEYFFKLGSHGRQLYDNQGSPFSITTGPMLSTASSTDTAYGKVYTPANTPADGAIIFISLPSATPLSTLVKQNGDWTINLAGARSRDLAQSATYDLQETILDILVQSDTGDTTNILTLTANDQPVPDIISGTNADYTGNQPAYLQSTEEVADQSRFSVSRLTATEPEPGTNIEIDTIPADNTILTQNKPTISGTAPAGVEITITVHSSELITDNVLVDNDGAWSWQPSVGLSPGEHTITLSYADESGLLHSLTRNFIVQDSAAGPGYQATPSATLTPTLTTPTPPTSITPSRTPTTIPTLRPTSTSTQSGVPVAGNASTTYLFLLTGFTLIACGAIFYRHTIHS